MKKNQSKTNWENPSDDSFDILPSGLPPLWKPEAGNVIHFRPDSVQPFKQKKGKKGKKIITKVNYAISGLLVGGEAVNFFNGSNPATVKFGDRITVGSSYNLIGPDKLVTEDGELSKMAERVQKEEKAFFLRFDGKIKQANSAKTVNQFTVGVPKGFRS